MRKSYKYKMRKRRRQYKDIYQLFGDKALQGKNLEITRSKEVAVLLERGSAERLEKLFKDEIFFHRYRYR